MILRSQLWLALIVVSLSFATAQEATAQVTIEDSSAFRLQSRFVNPFAAQRLSRLTANPFGLPALKTDVFGESETVTVAEIEAPVVESAAAPPTGSATTAAVRPPYRPRVRSPFRPPPRPPF